MAGVAKEAVVPIEAVLLGLAIVLVLARLWLRLVRQHQKLTISDWILVVSLLDAIALFTTDTMTHNLGGMDEYDPNAPEAPVEEQIRLMKVSFAGNYFYDTGIYFPKIALLAFYFKLIPPTMPLLRKALYGVSALTVTFAVTTCFLDTFWCGPNVSVNWDIEGSCNTFDSKEVFRIDWALNFVSDVLIFTIPFPLLLGLQLSRRYIIGLVAIFSTGIITIGASVGRFATVEAIHAWTNVYVLSMTEVAAAIIVVSLPALKSLLHRRGLATSKYGTGQTGSAGRAYDKHPTNFSRGHIKLSSGRESYVATARAVSEEESGSEVELNNLERSGVIYKSARSLSTQSTSPESLQSPVPCCFLKPSDDMAYFIDGKDCMISEWILLATSYVFVALRVYTRLFRLRERLTWSDILLVLSAINALALIICDTLTFRLGVMDNWEPSVTLSKISFASNYFYDVGMGFPKMSMLAFYWAYFPSTTSPAMRKALWGITAFVCLSYTAILWDDTFFCGKKVSVQWSQEDGACSVFYAPEPFIVNFTLNLACYLCVYVLPLTLLIQGVLERSTGLTLTFVLGTLTILTTIVRFICLKVGTGQENLVYPLSILEMTLAITVVALPGLKPLLNRQSAKSSVEAVQVDHESKNFSS
ncbi:archaeal flagellin N-terminal-like domain-containing protein [Colletotrichum orchidophilum]|uniref:Archaeal flagellin N-terminal-like domain-containing protein n=1 Tax=Colletotrichum orchidophilum TaxID=1209926 RepID=A0A1G4B141_9PEZI|nr:archaeal flagellin N-terminal-like domain-containing protein [Colletotrichum orchidophilum]OHE95097.1 archaeal flagellin N-terminal-like domain-containing protein [Colletotrichum orchidophilum]